MFLLIFRKFYSKNLLIIPNSHFFVYNSNIKCFYTPSSFQFLINSTLNSLKHLRVAQSNSHSFNVKDSPQILPSTFFFFYILTPPNISFTFYFTFIPSFCLVPFLILFLLEKNENPTLFDLIFSKRIQF